MADIEATASSQHFKWTDDNTADLIEWRTANTGRFTGKRNAACKGFKTYIKEKGLQGKVQAAWLKKKWENLKAKYKDLKSPTTGVSTEGGETTAASWKWYGAMDEALGTSHVITPPVLISSSSPCPPYEAVASSPFTERQESVGHRGSKRKREIGDLWKLVEERDAATRRADEEKEAEAERLEREREEAREAKYREEWKAERQRMEKERMDAEREYREERAAERARWERERAEREKERKAEREGWEREKVEREEERRAERERWEKERAERERERQQRDKESAEREGRLMRLLEGVMSRK